MRLDLLFFSGAVTIRRRSFIQRFKSLFKWKGKRK